jgi:HNH endonuclease
MTLPCSLAWEAFGQANGATDLAQMRARISRYRHLDSNDRSDFPIGCRVLTQAFFKQEEEWLPVPESWSKNIVTFKTYSTDSDDGKHLWEWAQSALGGSLQGFAEEGQRFGEPTLIRPRLGQGAFRLVVTDAYHRRCAVTGERTLPALDAAHIRPYSEGGEHSVSNGLLLHRDIHCLFDLGYVTVTPDRIFEVSQRIREEFENGRDYYAFCRAGR